MNTARNRRYEMTLLEWSQRSTEELQQILIARDPARPSRYVHNAATRRAVAHVLRVRAIVSPAEYSTMVAGAQAKLEALTSFDFDLGDGATVTMHPWPDAGCFLGVERENRQVLADAGADVAAGDMDAADAIAHARRFPVLFTCPMNADGSPDKNNFGEVEVAEGLDLSRVNAFFGTRFTHAHFGGADEPALTPPAEPAAEHVRNATQMLNLARGLVSTLPDSADRAELAAHLDGAVQRLALALAQLEPR